MPRADAPEPERRFDLAVVASVAFLFVIYSVVHSPVPGAGEPHYLTKARHFVDPDWCRGDFFLESSNAHAVFYAAIGWLTCLVSFETTAWIGRAVGFFLLAWGWTRLIRQLVPARWAPLAVAAVYSAEAGIGNFSGEWILNGFEGKVVSYALLFFGWAWLLEGRVLAGAALGGAISFHPLVGGWGLIAALGGCVWRRLSGSAVASQLSAPEPSKSSPDDWPVRKILIAGVGLLATAAPGVVAAASALGGGDSHKADYIQVFYRLSHHLDPTTFSRAAWIASAAMLAVWLLSRRWESKTPAQRWWTGCVLASVVIAAAGAVIGWGPRPPQGMPLLDLRMRLMKFYPFRLVDVLLPMALAASIVEASRRWLLRCRPSPSDRPSLAVRSSAFLVFLAIFLGGLGMAYETRYRPPVPPSRLQAWRDVCDWIQSRTDEGAVFLTPQESWAFKWFAQRPEYVSYKDCPQDAAGIIEWNRRLRFLRLWADEEWNDGYSREAAMRLRQSTGITHVLSRDLGPFALTPIYENDVYRVFELSDAATESP